MDKAILVQEQGGNTTFDISGFKRIEIQDDMEALRLIRPEATEELYSIRVFFEFEGRGGQNVVLGRYVDYKDALAYYTALIAKLAAGSTFISMLPGEDREMQERAEQEPASR